MKVGEGNRAFKFADDTLAVTVDVCTDLHDRRAPITAGQRRQHWFGWQARNFHLAPRKSFDAKGNPNFFGNRGLRVGVEDDLGRWIRQFVFLFGSLVRPFRKSHFGFGLDSQVFGSRAKSATSCSDEPIRCGLTPKRSSGSPYRLSQMVR